MLGLTRRRRELIAEKLADLANLAAAALVFGQALGAQGFSLPVAALGLAIWAACIATAWVLSGER
jgi:hypothetical protein